MEDAADELTKWIVGILIFGVVSPCTT